MKKLLAVLLTVFMIIGLAGCGENNNGSSGNTSNNTSEFTGKAIVVYYSASGNTGRVAEAVANELGADTFEIVPVETYSEADLNWRDRSSRVNKEHDDASLQNIELASTEVPDWSEYDVVMFGYPI